MEFTLKDGIYFEMHPKIKWIAGWIKEWRDVIKQI